MHCEMLELGAFTGNVIQTHFLHGPDETLLGDLHRADTRTSDGQILIWLGNGIKDHLGSCGR